MTQINIFSTSDVHGYLEDGLMNIKEKLNDYKNTLLIDNGDFFIGSPFSTYIYKTGQLSPMINVANDLNYDIMIPGNHDLDYGVNWLKYQVTHLDAVICSP